MQGFGPKAVLEACLLGILLRNGLSRSLLFPFEETHVLEVQFVSCFLKDLRKGK